MADNDVVICKSRQWPHTTAADPPLNEINKLNVRIRHQRGRQNGSSVRSTNDNLLHGRGKLFLKYPR